MSTCEEQLKENCEWIAEKLEGLADGKLYDQEAGELVDRESIEDENNCYDESRYQDLWAYLSDDNYGIKITTDLDGSSLYGADICVAFGGPNIYIETRDSCVRGYWGSDRVEVPLSYSACDAINDIIDEWRSCY